MNLREYRKLKNNRQRELVILEHSSLVKIRQRKPYTFVELELQTDKGPYTGFDFSKVCFPDKWSKDIGEKVATNRAVRDIRRQLDEG